MSEVLLEAERIHVRHDGADHDAVRDVSLRVHAGQILALAGPNGCGKSTLVGALGHTLPLRAGAVRLAGTDLRRFSRRRLARRLGTLPQEPAWPEGLTVGALVQSGRYPHVGPFASPEQGDHDAVREALAAVSMSDFRSRELETLSGGERRRAWIAMVLAQQADLLLLDEPTTALDVRHQWEVLELLAEANRERGLTLVVVLHDLEQAASIAHRVALVHRGRLYAVGAPEQVLDEQSLRDVFGVDARVTKEDGVLRVRVRGPADPIRSL